MIVSIIGCFEIKFLDEVSTKAIIQLDETGLKF
jgi:hypothetical protein